MNYRFRWVRAPVVLNLSLVALPFAFAYLFRREQPALRRAATDEAGV